ncbi:UNVERIFIED_CONTAM: putative receptor-like protein kinase [Sesamum calycinum]|uniref:Receptor-like protein kinase n=1 Tax=Sesamum calycinum TaxID=2727403 RepID=A0AAW2RPE4_9LAMI
MVLTLKFKYYPHRQTFTSSHPSTSTSFLVYIIRLTPAPNRQHSCNSAFFFFFFFFTLHPSSAPESDAPIYYSSMEVEPAISPLGPGAPVGTGKPHFLSNHKLLISSIAASTALGLIIILFLLYIYHRKYKHKSQDKNNHTIIRQPLCCCQETLWGNLDAIKEFQTEVELLSKIQHPNIITLLGYSIHADTRLLIYELMEYGSLETQLHGPSRGSALTWNLRMKIALDAARGLEYLHEHCHPPVIHRDLKSSNILLDSNFNAKLSDFGLAILDGTQNKNNIKLSGTLGYVAPEYLLDGKLTDKSDVYAFGVVLLELLLGRKPVEKIAPARCQSMVTWAMPQLTDRTKLPHIVDPVIRNSVDLKHLYQVAAVAVLCVQPEPSYRPLITDILHSLVPLVPVELGGTLREAKAVATTPSEI